MNKTIICKECGKSIPGESVKFLRDFHEKHKLCNECHWWLSDLKQLNTFIVKGELYFFYEEQVYENTLPLFPEKWRKHIMFFTKPGKPVIYGYVDHKGPIPEHFHKKYPDDAVFYKEHTLKLLGKLK